MSGFKFLKYTDPSHPNYNPLIEKWYFKAYNHWLCPLGNYHEPLPYPQIRVDQAKTKNMHPWLWWTLRNPLHNLKSLWVGLAGIGERYEWITPQENGWSSYRAEGSNWSIWRKEKRIPLFYYKHTGPKWQVMIGWKSIGTVSLTVRRSEGRNAS